MNSKRTRTTSLWLVELPDQLRKATVLAGTRAFLALDPAVIAAPGHLKSFAHLPNVKDTDVIGGLSGAAAGSRFL